MVVRELLASIGIKVDEKSVEAADKAIERIKDSLKELVAAYIGFEGVKKVAEKFAQLGESATQLEALAKKTGMNTDALQELHYAAAQTATDASELDQGLIHLQRSAFEAATQGGEAGAAFKRLGIEVLGANGKVRPTNELLGMVADKFAVLPDGVEKTALSMALLSRSGAALVPMLSKGSAGLAQFGVDARRTGGVMSEGLIKAGEDLDTVITNLKFTFRGLTYAILGPFVHAVTEGVKAVASWLAVHRQIISLRIQEVVSVIAGAFQLAARGAQALGGWLLPIGAILLGLLSPISLVTGALLLLANDFNRYLDGKDSLIGRVIYAFKQVWKSFGESEDPFLWLLTAAQKVMRQIVLLAGDLPRQILQAMLLANQVFLNAPALLAIGAAGMLAPGKSGGNAGPDDPTGLGNLLKLGMRINDVFQNPFNAILPAAYVMSPASAPLSRGQISIGKIEIIAPTGDATDITDKLKSVMQQLIDDNLSEADPGRY